MMGEWMVIKPWFKSSFDRVTSVDLGRWNNEHPADEPH